MLIGVFSDVHDQLNNLTRTLDIFREQHISTLIFCGDFCSPIPSRMMGAYHGEVHCVFGNGDGDRFKITQFASTEFPNLILHGEHGELELDGIKMAITHYPFYAQALARTGDYAAVFSGHTHEFFIEKFGETLWLNPGEVMGFKGSPTCAIYDLNANSAKIIRL